MARTTDIETMGMAELEALEARIAERKRELAQSREAELVAELAAVRKLLGRKTRGPRKP